MLNKLRRAVEKVIAPGAALSYSQSGEDLVLEFLTDYSPRGFYVDVGCNDPVKMSNTFRFYRKGWQGICIDANAGFAQAYRSKRPRDTFVAACVSDKPETLTFHHFAQSALSSVSGRPLYENEEHYAVQRVETLEAQTLNDILALRDCPAEFDILSIDVEGQDEKALRGIDLDRYRPRAIVIESDTPLVGHISDHPIARMLTGYRPMAAHWNNLFFCRN